MRRLRSTAHFLCVPLSNALKLTRAIAPVNRQNGGIVKICTGVADWPRIRFVPRVLSAQGKVTEPCFGTDERAPFCTRRYACRRKTATATEPKLASTYRNLRGFRNLYSYSFVARLV